ncbi:hypothetical protein D0862_09946 [Hortaea werneckii]|uniref:Endonuclease/exonuclease/phosphatase domain-containing protein n=1 Tax=Hortaea werneckii TaxID=91943 RepID=A0A3M7FQ84_HORWE|nr:hypothetical protein D0862_09946 [Hortaea werneckii]
MGEQGKLIRLCNTHLESLALDPPLRPLQVQLCAQYMHEGTVDGAMLAGDLNAIQDFDRRLHSDNDLKDAYLELGGIEDDAEAGHTWGQQAATAQRQQFGTSRMDKIFYCGDVMCTAFERFGAGIEMQHEGEREEILSLGFDRPWITDHLGVRSRACPHIGLLGGLASGGGLPPASPLPMPNNSLLPNPRQVQAGLGQIASPAGYGGNDSFNGLHPYGAPPAPRNGWDCDPPLPNHSPLRGKYDWGPPLPKDSPLRQLWGQRWSVHTPPRAQSAQAGTASASLSFIGQPALSQPTMRPVMLPCVTGSLPGSQTAAASKAPASQELVQPDPNANGAPVRGPTLYDLEPKYRQGPAIPMGKGMELNGQRLEPTQGKQGYGIYAPSSEENVIDFYPVNGAGLSNQEAPLQAPQSDLQPLETPAKEPALPAQPEFIPFDWEPPNAGPDLVDPKFRE